MKTLKRFEELEITGDLQQGKIQNYCRSVFEAHITAIEEEVTTLYNDPNAFQNGDFETLRIPKRTLRLATVGMDPAQIEQAMPIYFKTWLVGAGYPVFDVTKKNDAFVLRMLRAQLSKA